MPIVIDHIALKDILGPPVFEMEVKSWVQQTEQHLQIIGSVHIPQVVNYRNLNRH